MGLFDKLRGGAPSALALDIRPEQAVPGGRIAVRFQATGPLDPNMRGVRLTLEGSASYKAQVTRTYGAGDDTNTATTEEWQSYSLHKDERDVAAPAGSGEVEFTVPSNAPPSSSGAVAWAVSARVVRDRGTDKAVRATVDVRQHPERVPADRGPQQDNDGLTLDIPVAVRAGETLEGRLVVAVAKDVNASRVQVRLYRRVTYTGAPMTDGTIYGGASLSFVPFVGKGHISSELKIAEIEVSGKRSFAAGSTETIPFAIGVPATAGPTTAHAYARVEWRVEAVIDRRMRGDLTVETPLAVI